ncbi:carboxypeptidase-like regulatory domain-containing protein [Soonwooa sp.]|uniref:carboxypeptidase-like regulatory domain-containing protein n=1 Tax=Soonwooa sp. TaxID=1938592 RepID=UPI0026355006|nr:carboxypeptidase-like regulatory domain-containing protein [Soonwooa sp.]
MKLKHTNIYLGLFLLILMSSSCIQRLRRPDITGRVLDYNGKPIENCIVGETKTDKNGNFHLPAETYNAFLLSEIFVMEAPPMMVD